MRLSGLIFREKTLSNNNKSDASTQTGAANGTGYISPSDSNTADVVTGVSTSANSKADSQLTTTFIDELPTQEVKFITPNNMVAINDRQDAIDLQTFLSRPVLISTLTWGSGGVSSSIYPWHLYATNTYVENKLKSFNLLRANLHLRFEISGSPFVYGGCQVDYTPMYNYLTDATSNGAYLMHTSQRPHVWLYPQESSGAEMILPFFWKANFANMLDEDTLKYLGRLTYYSWYALDTANDVAIPDLSIHTYAWLEQPYLEGPTSQAILQAGSDEYSKGPVERIASAVATVANAVAVIPEIAPFALATAMGAKAMSTVAALFGWSKVAVIENSTPTVHNPYHGMASSEVSTPIQKLSLDPKTEITVDPRVVNLSGQDELNLNYLTSKQCYLVTDTWSNEAVGTKLLSFPVSPMLNMQYTTGEVTTRVHSPMGYFGQLFTKWRGDIIFTIKIVATSYHRGKLRVAFDPYGVVGADDYSNIIQTKIIDISNTTEVEFVCPYMQDSTWCTVPEAYSATLDFTDGTDVAYEEGYNNGVLAIHVLSPLSSPQAAPTCFIKVDVRGGPNLEFAEPGILKEHSSHLEIQSGSAITAGKTHPQEYLVNYGENIVSLRQLLSRSSWSQRYFPVADFDLDYDGVAEVVLTTSLVPNPYGYNPDGHLYSEGLDTVETNFRFVYSRMHPINWVAACFAARRGSLQLLLELGDLTERSVQFYTLRGNYARSANQNYLEGYRSWYVTEGTDDQQSCTQSNIVSSGQAGMARANKSTGNVLHIEAESRSRFLFTSTRQEDWLIGDTKDNSDRDWLYAIVTCAPNTTSGLMFVDKFVNIGPDFNLHFFVNTPLVYYNADLGQEKYVAE